MLIPKFLAMLNRQDKYNLKIKVNYPLSSNFVILYIGRLWQEFVINPD